MSVLLLLAVAMAAAQPVPPACGLQEAGALVLPPAAGERTTGEAAPEGQGLLPSFPLDSPSFGPLQPPDENWVEATLARMTLDDKLGQMIMPSYSSSSADALVTNQRVGGFIFLGNNNTASALLAATTHLQQITSVPLLFAIDCEAGLGARVVDATRFPLNMSSGAAQSVELVTLQGRVTARECRAVGIHIGFGPVLDVNTEPVNPIIGVRAYGDHPKIVTALAAAYVEGARAEGLLCTFKHFPGHGATTGDSHSSLPVVDISCDELRAVHVAPYRELLGRGLGDLVMSAHVWYTCLDPGTTAWPATLSTNALTGMLRNELGYDGAVISDSYGMAGLLAAASTYDAARLGVQAGLDIILMPTSVTDALNGLRDAVNSGTIPMARIDQSVRRILRLKSRIGLPATAIVDPTVMQATVGHPHHRAVAEALGRRAVAWARPNPAEFPTTSSRRILCLSLDASSSIFYLYSGNYFLDEFVRFHENATTRTVATNITASQRNQILSLVAQHDGVVVVSRDWKPTIATNQQLLVQALIDTGKPVAYCSLGSPYHVAMFSGLRNYFCGFSSHYAVQQAMAAVVAGQGTVRGNWPVAMPDGVLVPPLRDFTPTNSSSVSEWAAHSP